MVLAGGLTWVFQLYVNLCWNLTQLPKKISFDSIVACCYWIKFDLLLLFGGFLVLALLLALRQKHFTILGGIVPLPMALDCLCVLTCT
jgi:hypothetical protein